MVCPSYQPQPVACGVGDYTARLATELARQGEDIEVLCSTAYRGSADGPVRVIPDVERWTLGVARDTLRRRMRGRDVLHLQYTPVLYGPRAGFRLVTVLARLRRIRVPTVVTFHTLTGVSRSSAVWALLLLASAGASIAANMEVEGMVRRRLPALARRLRTIAIGANVEPGTNGLPAADRVAGRSVLGVPPAIPLLVHFGLLYPGKGLETLLDAFALLRRRNPSARLAVVGDTPPEHEPYRRDLERRAMSQGISDAIVWAGRRSEREVSSILAAADVFVAPYDDGVSSRRGSLLAALAHGLPIVSTRPAVETSQFRDGDNIALVPRRDPVALAARLESLLHGADEVAGLRRGAAALAASFAWPTIGAETRRVYAQVMAR
jgi:glycosyltransferase involved in cell wall biosynthesis